MSDRLACCCLEQFWSTRNLSTINCRGRVVAWYLDRDVQISKTSTSKELKAPTRLRRRGCLPQMPEERAVEMGSTLAST